MIRPFGGMTPNDLENEIRALDKLSTHDAPNLVKILKFGRLVNSQYHHIDMELCDLNLDSYIKHEWGNVTRKGRYFGKQVSKKSLSHIWSIMKDITCGVAFMHNLGQVHRDLKPRNGITPLFRKLIKSYIPKSKTYGKSLILD